MAGSIQRAPYRPPPFVPGGGRGGQGGPGVSMSRGSSGGRQPTWDDYYRGQAQKAAGAGTAARVYREAAMGGLFGAGGSISPAPSPSFAGLQAAGGILGGYDGAGSTSRASAGTMAGGGRIAPIDTSVAPIDTSAADAATFARVKDRVGLTGRASLESLRGLLGETGQLGGGAEVQGVRDIVEHAAGQVGDVQRAQAIQGAERSYQTAAANQQAALTQRGQDIGVQDAAARRALAQTQLQFQQAQMHSQQQLDLLRLALQHVPGQLMY